MSRKELMSRYPEFKNPMSHPRFTGIPSFMRAPIIEDLADYDIAMIGVPYDGGVTNRTGARLGPRDVRIQSTMMRCYNNATGAAPYEWCKVGDGGDAWPVQVFELETAHAEIEGFFHDVKDAGTLPLSVGGDHSITLPILRALAKDGPIGLIHFDAHCDTGGNYQGSAHHHGSTFSAAVNEGLLDPKRCVQIGIRGGTITSGLWKFSYEHGMTVITIDELYDMGIDEAMAKAVEIVGDGPIYASFDVDVMDPVYAPGTGTPEVGGITSYEALRMVRKLAGTNIVGADVVEVSPPFDQTGGTALVAATVMFELLCVMAEQFKPSEDK